MDINKAESIRIENRNLEKNLSELNTNRGNGALYGFVNESMNAKSNNVNNVQKGIKAREIVIDNNGPADSQIKYSNNTGGRQIQYKFGYSASAHKQNIKSGKYDDMIYRINKDHVLNDPQNKAKLDELKSLAKEHNIKIEFSKIPDRNVRDAAFMMQKEGDIRASIGLESNAPVTAKIIGNVENLKDQCNNFQYKVLDIRDTKIKNINDFISSSTEKFLSNDLAKLNKAGVEAGLEAAEFVAVLSVVTNTRSLIKGDKGLDEAAKDVLTDISKSAVLGYATGTLSQLSGIGAGEIGVLATGTIQISKQISSYVSGEINESELFQNIAETSALLAAAYIGRGVGGAIGEMLLGPVGAIIGKYIGEVITTAVCSEIIDTINFNKNFNREIDRISSLYRRAEQEIRDSQKRLEYLIQKENEVLKQAIYTGWSEIIVGIQNNSYDDIKKGILIIGEKFNLTVDEIERDTVTKENIFTRSNTPILLT